MGPATKKGRASGTEGPNRACDNPDCRRRLWWSPGRGRPPKFCSDACRKRAVGAAGRLAREADAVDAQLKTYDLTYRQRRLLEGDLARILWLLSAYPDSISRKTP